MNNHFFKKLEESVYLSYRAVANYRSASPRVYAVPFRNSDEKAYGLYRAVDTLARQQKPCTFSRRMLLELADNLSAYFTPRISLHQPTPSPPLP